MLVCESEENRRKLAWLVPGYILLAWFFCVVFQPLGFTNIPGRGNNNDLNDESLYEIINLQDDPQVKKIFFGFVEYYRILLWIAFHGYKNENF